MGPRTTALDLSRFEILTFDCYGTLIDWESGLATALARILQDHGIESSREHLLALHADFEPAAQAGAYKPYREILAEVVDRFGRHYGFQPTDEERMALAESIREWPAFEDTATALRLLASSRKLAILSNIDDDLFALSVPRLGVDFDWIVTAEQVRSYKPATAHFEEALMRFGAPRERILHVAQSLFHDIAPARALGFHTVWVHRRAGQEGTGATPASPAVPDLEVPDLASLARLLS